MNNPKLVFECGDRPSSTDSRLSVEEINASYYPSVHQSTELDPSIQACIIYFLNKSACGPIQTSQVEVIPHQTILFRRGSEEVQLSYTFLKDVCDVIPLLDMDQLRKIEEIANTNFNRNRILGEISCYNRNQKQSQNPSSQNQNQNIFVKYYCQLARSHLAPNLAEEIRSTIPIKAFALAVIYATTRYTSSLSALMGINIDYQGSLKRLVEERLSQPVSAAMLDALIKENNWLRSKNIVGLTTNLRESIMGLSDIDEDYRKNHGNQSFNSILYQKEHGENIHPISSLKEATTTLRIDHASKIPSDMDDTIQTLIRFYLGNVKYKALIPSFVRGVRTVKVVKRSNTIDYFLFEDTGEGGKTVYFSYPDLRGVTSATPYLSYRQLSEIHKHLASFSSNTNTSMDLSGLDRGRFMRVVVAFVAILMPNNVYQKILSTMGYQSAYLKYHKGIEAPSYDVLMNVFTQIGQCGEDHRIEDLLKIYNDLMEYSPSSFSPQNRRLIRGKMEIIACNARKLMEYTRMEAMPCRATQTCPTSLATLGGKKRKQK